MSQHLWDSNYSQHIESQTLANYFKPTNLVQQLLAIKNLKLIQKAKKISSTGADVIVFCSPKRNAPNLGLGDPRSESRPFVKSYKKQANENKDEWNKFLSKIEPEEILSFRAKKHSQRKLRPQSQTTAKTRSCSGVSRPATAQISSTRKLQRPQTGKIKSVNCLNLQFKRNALSTARLPQPQSPTNIERDCSKLSVNLSLNLSTTLLKTLNINKTVKYFKDTTLLQLTGIKPEGPRSQLDWALCALCNHSLMFNEHKNPLYLVEDQVSYCLNLLRYTLLDDNETLQKMFNLVIATCQYIYYELGLNYEFNQKVSDKLDGKVIDQSIVKRLLVRIQLMLSVRVQVHSIFKWIKAVDQQVDKFCKMQFKGGEQEVQQQASAKCEEIKQSVQGCVDEIARFVQERWQIVGRKFVYQGVDYCKEKAFLIKINADILRDLSKHHKID